MHRLRIDPSACARQVALQRAKHPDRVPVYIEPDVFFFSRLDPDTAEFARRALDKRRLAPPSDWTVGQFLSTLRANLCLKPAHALFVFASPTLDDHVLPPVSQTMEDLYEHFFDRTTGMLWLTLAIEASFGS